HCQSRPGQIVGATAGEWERRERLEVPVPARRQLVQRAARQFRVVKLCEERALSGDEILAHASPLVVRKRSARSSLTAAIGRKRRNRRNKSAKKAMLPTRIERSTHVGAYS